MFRDYAERGNVFRQAFQRPVPAGSRLMAKRLATDRVLLWASPSFSSAPACSCCGARLSPSPRAGARVNGEAIMVRQLFWAVLGVAVMLASLRFDYRILRSRYVAFSHPRAGHASCSWAPSPRPR